MNRKYWLNVLKKRTISKAEVKKFNKSVEAYKLINANWQENYKL